MHPPDMHPPDTIPTPAPSDEASGGTAVTPFASLDEMRAAHARLLETMPADDLAADDSDKIREFLRQGRATGRLLDVPADRSVAQGMLNYWAATLYTQRRTANQGRVTELPGSQVPKGLLADFDAGSLLSVVKAVE